MATIASKVFPGAAVAGASAPSDKARSGGSPNDFMDLVNGMIQGNTSGEQLPSNLLQLLLTGDGSGLDGTLDGAGGEGDTAENQDGDGADDAAALGLAAMLAGLQQAGAGNASDGDSAGASSMGAAGSQREQALQGLLGVGSSEAALSGALGGALGSALDGTSGAFGAGSTGAAGPAGADAASGAAAAGAGPGAPGDPNALNAANANGAAHLQNALMAHRAADMAPQAASAEVRTPVGAPGWSDEIGTHLAIMAANGREAASLRLSPEHLGPLDIQISMKDGQANVVFNASNPETRQALEQSLSRLREMFAAQGLTLGNANVSRDAPRDSHKPAPVIHGVRGSSDASADISVKRVTLARLGLVDTYV
jgi:flagellar hook-length control protein FliK